MKRFWSFILILCLVAGLVPSVTGEGDPVLPEEIVEVPDGDDSEVVPMEDAADPEDGAEEDDGDDSNPVPLEMLEDDGVEEEIVEARVLQYGDEGDDVLEMQTRLKELKYYTGNLSGRYREGTREAIRSFQEDFGLEATGIADIETQSLLFSTLYRPLRYGSTGDDVITLQTRLTDLGYYKGKISGKFLEATRSAVTHFQEMNGLDADGVADPETQSLLFSGRALSKDAEVASATATPAPDLSNYLVDENSNSNVIMPETAVAFTKKIKNGSSGKLVKQLQERMAELGYYDGPISGNFMVKTTRAVKKIQEQNALPVNGVVDEETWNVIFNDARIVMPDATPKPTPEPTPVPFAITVDVANQVTTVYGRDDEGNYSVVIRQMLCSTGMKATPSDPGDWVLNGRKARWCYFPKWGSYARYWTRINSSIAFHSVIYNSVSTTNMATKSYKRLGNRASHGCIRLTVADAKWIYDNVGEGTVVSIIENMDPDPELQDALKLPPLNEKSQTPVSTPEPTAEPDYQHMDVPQLGNRTLREKSESPEVYWVQRRLAELGYYKGKCSGKFLAGTKKAVKEFQRDQRIYQTGEVDQRTIDYLAAAGVPTPEPTATPEPDENIESASAPTTPAPIG